METYISILRGINVSGQKSIKMADLKMLFEKLGFTGVKTYVQSGNVIFQYRNENPKEIEQKIQNEIKSAYGFDVPVIVFQAEKFQQIVLANPFKDDTTKETSHLYVTFLASPPEIYDSEAILNKKSGREEIEFSNEAVYLYCPNGYSKSKLSNNLLENKLKVTATTRNWKSCNEILKIAGLMS